MNDIDIIMTTFNGEKFLSEQIKSIKAQTVSCWRLIISDDGSNDSTLEIIEKERRGWEKNIIILGSKRKQYGISRNFFRLLEVSTAEYIVFCDQDDIWFNNKLERLLEVMKEEEIKGKMKIPLLIHSKEKSIDRKSNIMREKVVAAYTKKRSKTKQLVVQNVVTGCTMMINKLLKDFILPYNDRMIMHDWWIALIASIVGKIFFIDETLIYRRKHEGNAVGKKETIYRSLVIEIKRVIYPKKYNHYKKYVEQAKALHKHLCKKGVDKKKLIDLTLFISISNKKTFITLLLMLVKKYVKNPFYRNLYLLSIGKL